MNASVCEWVFISLTHLPHWHTKPRSMTERLNLPSFLYVFFCADQACELSVVLKDALAFFGLGPFNCPFSFIYALMFVFHTVQFHFRLMILVSETQTLPHSQFVIDLLSIAILMHFWAGLLFSVDDCTFILSLYF